MSDWNSIYQGIGLLGQTKRGMHTPMIDAYRNKGKVWSEGLGRISDTLGGIADKRWQTKEREGAEAHEVGMQESEHTYQANQKLLDRALERDKIWATMFESTQDRDAMIMEASKDRQLQRELRAAAEAATNERQKADLAEQIRQFDIKVEQWDDTFKREGIQWEDEKGLRGRELGIRETEANARLAALQHEIDLEKADPKVAAAYRSIIEQIKLDRPELFLSVDEAGYQYERGLRELSPAEKRELSTMFDDRVTTDYNDIRDGLFRLFNGALGEMGEDGGGGGLVTPRGQDELSPIEAMKEYILSNFLPTEMGTEEAVSLSTPSGDFPGGFTLPRTKQTEQFPDSEAPYREEIATLTEMATTMDQLRKLDNAAKLIAKADTTRADTQTVESILKAIATELGTISNF